MTFRLFIAIAGTIATATAHAYGGWGGYDPHDAVTVSGTVVESSYRYPEATIRIRSAAASWLAVLGPPARLWARGLPKRNLQVGTHVTVHGYRSRRDPAMLGIESITTGGTTVRLR